MNLQSMKSLSAAEPQYGVGVDIGGTKIMIHIANVAGDIAYKRKVCATGKSEEIHGIIRETLDLASIPIEQVAAFGFGVPGITDTRKGIVIEAPALQWANMPIGETMSQYFNKPVFVDNDVNCAALGERWLGTAQKLEDFVFLALGTGVGSAIFANGSLVYGSDYMAGEIAYMVLDDDVLNRDSNAFGQFGLYEKRISGTSLSSHGYASDELFVKYAAGDQLAQNIVRKFVSNLAIGISNVVSLLNPQKVIIGGGVSQSLSILLEQVRTTVSKLTPVPVAIELSSLGEHSGAVGAAAMALGRIGRLKGYVSI